MTNEELVLAYQSGDVKALDSIIEKNEKIVCKLANKFYIGKSNAIGIEDLIQEGYIGLIEASKKYDLKNDKKAKFITYAVYWIYKKMHRFIEQKNTNHEVSLQIPVNEDGTEIGDTIKDSYDYCEYVERSLYHEEVRRALGGIMASELTLMESHIIKLNFGWDSECATIGEIARLYEEHSKVIVANRNRALDKMRKTEWVRKERRIRRREMAR